MPSGPRVHGRGDWIRTSVVRPRLDGALLRTAGGPRPPPEPTTTRGAHATRRVSRGLRPLRRKSRSATRLPSRSLVRIHDRAVRSGEPPFAGRLPRGWSGRAELPNTSDLRCGSCPCHGSSPRRLRARHPPKRNSVQDKDLHFPIGYGPGSPHGWRARHALQHGPLPSLWVDGFPAHSRLRRARKLPGSAVRTSRSGVATRPTR